MDVYNQEFGYFLHICSYAVFVDLNNSPIMLWPLLKENCN